MSYTRRSNHDISYSNYNYNYNHSIGEHMIIDATLQNDHDDDDDEMILVFPSGNCRSDMCRSHTLPTTNATDFSMLSSSPILRPRHVSTSRLQLCGTRSTTYTNIGGADSTIAATMKTSNGTRIRLSPCRNSPSIWSILQHHQLDGSNSVGIATATTTTDRFYRSPLSPMNRNSGNQYHDHQMNPIKHDHLHQYHHAAQALCFGNISVHHTDLLHQMGNCSILDQSPDHKTPTNTLPFIPVIPSPPVGEDDIGETTHLHFVPNDPSRDGSFCNENNVQVQERPDHPTSFATRTSTLHATPPPIITTSSTRTTTQQLPITTATLAASLRMRKQRNTPALLPTLSSPILQQQQQLGLLSTTTNAYTRMMPFESW